MSNDRNSPNHVTSWVLTLASLWFAFFAAIPGEVVDPNGDEQVAEQNEFESGDEVYSGDDDGPDQVGVVLLPATNLTHSEPPRIGVGHCGRPAFCSAPILSYAPKQSPPFSVFSIS
jgi:hypothetical protein